MDTKAAFETFREWWFAPEQKEIRLNVAEGWGFKLWLASRAAIEIELPEPNAHLIWIQAGDAPDDYWDDVEVSRSKEDKCCDGSDRYEVYAKWQLEEVFTSHGIRIKGKTE